jgi:hypothetical protein
MCGGDSSNDNTSRRLVKPRTSALVLLFSVALMGHLGAYEDGRVSEDLDREANRRL